jgi:hypothetical protein
VRIEVWSEKATVGGTVRPVLEEYGVAFRIFHGYGSATAVRSAAEESVSDARPLKVYYIGDYDPSGLHMSAKDLPERLERYGGEVELIRLALTAEDINSNLPSFPLSSKKGDPRCRWYREKTGLSQCWELDALSPVTLRDRLRANIEAEIDWAAWNRTLACEKAEKKSLDMVLAEWKRIIAEGSPRMEE